MGWMYIQVTRLKGRLTGEEFISAIPYCEKLINNLIIT